MTNIKIMLTKINFADLRKVRQEYNDTLVSNCIKNKDINSSIYICTSLNIDDNMNNIFYNNLKLKYNLIDKNNYIDLIKIDQKYREIYAIIDFIAAHTWTQKMTFELCRRVPRTQTTQVEQSVWLDIYTST